MPSTVPEAAPVAGDLAPDFTRPDVLANYIDQAADYIKSYGKTEGDWWDLGLDEHGRPTSISDYVDGASCCTVGAIAVSLGYRENRQVQEQVCGLPAHAPGEGHSSQEIGAAEPHPVLRAVMKALRFSRVESVFDWSDNRDEHEVVAELHEIAADLRLRATA